MKKENIKGFTLIELLVVIAIIGILSSVVLASLNSARNKGADAAIKSNLSNIRGQTSLYYDTNKAYSSVAMTLPVSSCSTANSIFDSTATNSAIRGIDSAVEASGGTAVCNLGGTTGSKASKWAVSVPLKSEGFWCADSEGLSKVRETALGITDVDC